MPFAALYSTPGEEIDLSALWPIGSVYTSILSTNPALTIGFGTWAAFGAGRVLVGLDAADTAFDVALETGGAKTSPSSGAVSQPTFTGTPANLAHTGSAVSAHSGAAVADHAAHTHTYTQVPNHVHVQQLQGGTTGATTGSHLMGSTATGGSLRSSAQSTLNPTGGTATGTTNGPSATLSHVVTQPADHVVTQPVEHAFTPQGSVSQPSYTGAQQSVLQPYIVVYFWQRTA